MKKIEFPRYLVTSSNNKQWYWSRGGHKRKNIFHLGLEEPVGVQIYQTACGLTIDVTEEGNQELPSSPDGNDYRCCLKCLEAQND